MIDEAKRLKTRFKKSKDFYKTIEKLKKEGYYVLSSSKEDIGIIINGEQTNEKLIMVGRNNVLVSVFYEENTDATSEYKQLIHYITY